MIFGRSSERLMIPNRCSARLNIRSLILLLLLYSLLVLFLTRDVNGQRRKRYKSIPADTINAILSESLRSNRVQACEGRRVLLHCPKNTQLLIKNTFYGRLVPSSQLCPPSASSASSSASASASWSPRNLYEDTSCDVSNAKNKVVEQCKNRRKCRVIAKPSYFGRDPCPTTSKYLQISYKCKPVSFDDQSFCEGSKMQLKCKSGKRLTIYSAEYGRSVNRRVVGCFPNAHISYDCTTDALAKLMPQCHAQKKCTVSVGDEHFGNPCAIGVRKYLNLVFMCVNEKVFSEEAIEGRLESMKSLLSSSKPLFGYFDAEEDLREFDEGSGREEIEWDTRQNVFSRDSVTERTPKHSGKTAVSNDAAYVPVPPEFAEITPPLETTPLDKRPQFLATTPPALSIPAQLPNALQLADAVLLAWQYAKDNKEKLALYFCVSASCGVILLLIACIGDQCYQKQKEMQEMQEKDETAAVDGEGTLRSCTDAVLLHQQQQQQASHYGHFEASTTPRTVFNAPEAIRNGFEVNDLSRNGPSYMRFNQLTPPRVPPVQHYYS